MLQDQTINITKGEQCEYSGLPLTRACVHEACPHPSFLCEDEACQCLFLHKPGHHIVTLTDAQQMLHTKFSHQKTWQAARTRLAEHCKRVQILLQNHHASESELRHFPEYMSELIAKKTSLGAFMAQHNRCDKMAEQFQRMVDSFETVYFPNAATTKTARQVNDGTLKISDEQLSVQGLLFTDKAFVSLEAENCTADNWPLVIKFYISISREPLQRLSLKHCQIDDSSLSKFLSNGVLKEQLVSLELDSNLITDEGTRFLYDERLLTNQPVVFNPSRGNNDHKLFHRLALLSLNDNIIKNSETLVRVASQIPSLSTLRLRLPLANELLLSNLPVTKVNYVKGPVVRPKTSKQVAMVLENLPNLRILKNFEVFRLTPDFYSNGQWTALAQQHQCASRITQLEAVTYRTFGVVRRGGLFGNRNIGTGLQTPSLFFPNARQLILWDCLISAETATEICTMKGLETLVVTDKAIGWMNQQRIAVVCDGLPKLKTLAIMDNRIVLVSEEQQGLFGGPQNQAVRRVISPPKYGAQAIGSLHNLEKLVLPGFDFSNVASSWLNSSITVLSLEWSNIGDDALATISRRLLSMKKLYLSNNRVGDQGVYVLSMLQPQLRVLSLRHNNLTGECVAPITRGLQLLEILSLGNELATVMPTPGNFIHSQQHHSKFIVHLPALKEYEARKGDIRSGEFYNIVLALLQRNKLNVQPLTRLRLYDQLFEDL